MTYVISIRIRKELKDLMDKIDVNWGEEIRRFLEERVKIELKKKFLQDAKKLRQKIGLKSPISAAELIREDREHEH